MEKSKILSHIKAVRLWLDKAENLLSENNIVKAVAILIIASSELQLPIREYFKIKKEEKRVSKVSKVIARVAIAASFVFIFGGIGYLTFTLGEKTRIITHIIEKPTKVVVQIAQPVQKMDQQVTVDNVEKVSKPIIVRKYVYKDVQEKEKLQTPQQEIVKIPTVIIDEKQIAEQKLDVKQKEDKIQLSQEEIVDLVKLAEKSLKGIQ